MSANKPKRSRAEPAKDDESYKGGVLDLGIPTLKERLKGRYVLYCRGSRVGDGYVKIAPVSIFAEQELHWISTHTFFCQDDLASVGPYIDGLYEAVMERFEQDKSVVEYRQGRDQIGPSFLIDHPPGLYMYEQDNS